MNSIFEKLGSYQILTNLLPGTFFGIAIRLFLNIHIPIENIAEEIILYYFYGLFISRIGSLITEPVLKKLRFIRFSNYTEFIKAIKTDSKIDTLSEMNNYLRSLLTCVLLLPIVKAAQVLSSQWDWFSMSWKWLLLAFIIVLLLVSYIKQCNYIRKRVDAVNHLPKDNS